MSYEAGAPYKGKLLDLPGFLKPRRSNTVGVVRHILGGEQSDALLRGGAGDGEDVLTGLKMTGYFLEHWVFNHHTHGIPDARLLFERRFAKTVEDHAIEKNEYVAG